MGGIPSRSVSRANSGVLRANSGVSRANSVQQGMFQRAFSSLSSSGKVIPEEEDANDTKLTAWRKVLTSEEARKRYEIEGTLSPGCAPSMLELRGYLDDHMLMKYIGTFGQGKPSYSAFLCWVDVQEYRSVGIQADNFRRSTALRIFSKYLKDGCKHSILFPESAEELLANLRSVLITAREKKTAISIDIFDALQQQCLQIVHDELFIPFKHSNTGIQIISNIHGNYNHVTPDDFEYIGLLGEGGFGMVVHARKKTTGKHYALKLQSKMGLLKCFKNALHRVDYEKQALASLNHPFIVALDYAFQTNTVCFLAMQLGSGGTLGDALNSCRNHRMPENNVRFIAAEIILALGHIHGLGMIYRDLKPPNVLLNADGHIKLVDMGGVVDPTGTVLGVRGETDEMANGLFAKEFLHKQQQRHSGLTPEHTMTNIHDTSGYKVDAPVSRVQSAVGAGLDSSPTSHTQPVSSTGTSTPPLQGTPSAVPQRARSITGTAGYMAMEMLLLNSRGHSENNGYTNAVDWYSLGVTLFVLLCGSLPFAVTREMVKYLDTALKEDPLYRDGVKMLLTQSVDVFPEEYLGAYNNMVQHDVSVLMADFILQLLDMNENTRLGSMTAGGLPVLMSHEVFRFIERNSDDGDKWHATDTASPITPSHAHATPGAFAVGGSAGVGRGEGELTLGKEGEVEFCWDFIEQRLIAPPFCPPASCVSNEPKWPNFPTMMTDLHKGNVLKQLPSQYYSEYFQSWDFISPQVLKMEYGLATANQQYDTKYKARQLLGPRAVM